MLILSPILAETLARAGVTKARLKELLFEHARIPAWKFERYLSGWTNLVAGQPTLAGLVASGRAPAFYAASDDPARLVPVVQRPEDIMVAVSGDPLRTNAYVFAHNGILGYPTTKAVALPAGWHRGCSRPARDSARGHRAPPATHGAERPVGAAALGAALLRGVDRRHAAPARRGAGAARAHAAGRPLPAPSRRGVPRRRSGGRRHRAFHGRGWTDGLPIVPPTLARVEAMLPSPPGPGPSRSARWSRCAGWPPWRRSRPTR